MDFTKELPIALGILSLKFLTINLKYASIRFRISLTKLISHRFFVVADTVVVAVGSLVVLDFNSAYFAGEKVVEPLFDT